MRFEKFNPQQLAAPRGAIIEGIDIGARFVPPSLGPEREHKSAAPAPAAAPTFTEAQMKEAEQTGYRKGFLEGEKEGRAQAEAAHGKQTEELVALVGVLSGKIEELIDMHNAYVEKKRIELPQLALIIARKVAGAALNDNALHLIDQTVKDCLERVLPAAHIVVSVHESLVSALEVRLVTHFAQNHDPGVITIQADPAMTIGDCRIEWDQGSASRDTATLWNDIEAVIARLSAPAETAPKPAAIPTPPTSDPTQEGA